MRRVATVSASLLLCAGLLAGCQKKPEATRTGQPAAANAPAPAAVGPPKRKPGLWVQAVNSAGMTQTSRICLDAATDAQLSAWGQSMADCSASNVTPTAGGWSFASECDLGQGGHVRTTGTATGDFNARYVVKATTVTSGSSMPQANGSHPMELTATWEGPCPSGMKPGDMTMTIPGTQQTMTMNLADMAAKK